MTITTVINGVTVGTTPSPASNITQLVLQVGTGAFTIQGLLTTGAGANGSEVSVWYAPCCDNIAASMASVEQLKSNAKKLPLKTFVPSRGYFFSTDGDMVCGGYLYLWVEEPKLPAAATLTVKVCEV